MSENPYESPQCQPEATFVESPLRKRAKLAFRVSAAVLFVPAIYNYVEFDARLVAPLPDDLEKLGRTLYVVGFVVSGLFLWQLGLPTLEGVSRLLRSVFANGTDRTAWEEVLHQSMTRLIYLAVPGAVLWMIWVFGFYQLHANYQVISWTVGVPAHLLGACWYVPLVYRWYRLAASGSACSTPPA